MSLLVIVPVIVPPANGNASDDDIGVNPNAVVTCELVILVN